MPINLSECKSSTARHPRQNPPHLHSTIVDMYVLVCSGNETRNGGDMIES